MFSSATGMIAIIIMIIISIIKDNNNVYLRLS
mgnify:FL=1